MEGMAQQFTPAPWAVWTSGRYVEVYAAEDHAQPVVRWHGFAQSLRPIAEQLANARLIATAPDFFSFAESRAEQGDDDARRLVTKATEASTTTERE
jgi:hypothetical protein